VVLTVVFVHFLLNRFLAEVDTTTLTTHTHTFFEEENTKTRKTGNYIFLFFLFHFSKTLVLCEILPSIRFTDMNCAQELLAGDIV
jgi:hypothetical protein